MCRPPPSDSHTVGGGYRDIVPKHFVPYAGAHGVVPIRREEGARLGEEPQVVEQSISLFNTVFQKETMTQCVKPNGVLYLQRHKWIMSLVTK